MMLRMRLPALVLVIVLMLAASVATWLVMNRDTDLAHTTLTSRTDKNSDDVVWADHYYAQEKDGTYLYEDISTTEETDSNRGGENRSSMLVQYQGIQNARVTLRFRYPDSARHGVVMCDAQCQFVSVDLYEGTLLISQSKIRISNDPFLFGMVHDALNGKLSGNLSGKSPEHASRG